MRIALLIESLAGGGSERVIERLSRGLAQRGHHVFVYCLRSALQSIGRMAAGGVIIREARSVGRDPLLAWRLARWLRQDRIEIVHAHSCAALAWVFPGAKLLGLQLLHVWHGWPLEMPTRYHRLAERLDRFVDRVGINSESLRTRFAPGRLARAATYLPNGIDLPTIARDPARVRLEALCGCALTSPLVLCVGNLRAEKDVCGMLAAFALLRRDWPQAQLIWLGSNSPLFQEQRYSLGPALVTRKCLRFQNFTAKGPLRWRRQPRSTRSEGSMKPSQSQRSGVVVPGLST